MRSESPNQNQPIIPTNHSLPTNYFFMFSFHPFKITILGQVCRKFNLVDKQKRL